MLTATTHLTMPGRCRARRNLASCAGHWSVLSAASVRGVSVVTAQMPYPLPHNCARIQWCLTTIVIGAGGTIAAKECLK